MSACKPVLYKLDSIIQFAVVRVYVRQLNTRDRDYCDHCVSVCQSVCPSVIDQGPVWGADSWGLRNIVLDRGS